MNSNKTYFIAEAGVNHNGDKTMAMKLIEEAAMAGANAIKFQTFNAKFKEFITARVIYFIFI